jgi:hypothetical protein
MNTNTVRQLIDEIANLAERVATFQARYGRNYTLKPGSPEEAWDLYNAIQDGQSIIAGMLEDDPRQNPHYRYGRWWERHEVLDTGVAQDLLAEAGHLLAHCAYASADADRTDYHYVMYTSQCNIAGMLHPVALQIAASGVTPTRYVS